MPTPLAAAGAYAKLARIADPATTLSTSLGNDPERANFGALVKQALGNVVETGHKSDAQVQAMANGKANIVDLVTAVAESETAITTLVAVRDRVIAAYQQILQMPI